MHLFQRHNHTRIWKTIATRAFVAAMCPLFLICVESTAMPQSVTHHPRFDYEYWHDQFTTRLTPEQRKKSHGTLGVSSPFELVAIEHHRESLFAGWDAGELETMSTDIFVWAVGDPPKPYLTKLGGAPFRPRSRDWPTDRKGKPLVFVGQICFLDSKDIIDRELPGDTLLVFSNRMEPVSDVYTEWVTRDLQEPVWTLEECPEPQYPIPRLHGYIHRSVDYPQWHKHRPAHISELDRLFDRPEFYVFQATKIGGVPEIGQTDSVLGLPILCAIHSVHPDREPMFVNLEKAELDRGGQMEPFELVEWMRQMNEKYRLEIPPVASLMFLWKDDDSANRFGEDLVGEGEDVVVVWAY